MDSTQPDCKLNDPANRNRIVPTIRLCLWCALFTFLLIFIFPVRVFSQNTAESPSTGDAKEASVTANRLQMGKQLSLIYCQTCHIYPQPELLDKKTWKNGVLPRMRIQLGLDPASINRNPEAAQLWATGKFPRFPLIADEQYKQISEYYLEAAPMNPLPQKPKGDLQLGLRQFKIHNPPFRVSPAMTTCIEISNSGRNIYLGDAQTRSLYILDARGNLLRTINVDNIPVSIHEGNQGLYLTCIGRFYPSEIPLGSLVFLKKESAQKISQKVLFSELPRPTHSAFADFNGDGRQDILMSMFGNFSGKFSLYQGLDNGDFQEKVLMDLPGAVRSEIHDFNGDGHPDIAVLMAQHYETFNLMINDGKGSFKTHEILRQHPVFGSSYFEMKDFNGDGRLDLILTNGDNGEYRSPHKNYHGIRIYLNQGDYKFEEAFFYPLNGAFKAMAVDFDEDGDLDLAAISYFPDYRLKPNDSFVYLENQGDLKFNAFTFKEAIIGRWLTMDAGDLDSDGDIDLVIGSVIKGPSDIPPELAKLWSEKGPSFLILENTLRRP